MSNRRWWRNLLHPPHGAHVQLTRRATFIKPSVSQATMRATLRAPGRKQSGR